jgi:hypothetical protein
MQPGTTPPQPIPELPQIPNTPVNSGMADSPFAQTTEGGAFASRSFANNMFGDILGTRPVTVGYRVPFTARFTGLTLDPASGGVRVNPNGEGSQLSFGPTPNGRTTTVTGPFSSNDLRYLQPTVGGNASVDTVFARSALQSLLSNGGLTAEQIQQFNRLSEADRQQLLANRGAINQTITEGSRGLAITQATVEDVQAQIVGNQIDYSAILSGATVVNLPAAGGVVGRMKLSEDNNPIPRDRFIFNYDYFDNAPLAANGFNISRFQFGIEKTFLNGRWSAEFRLPFAGTMNSTSTQGFETTNTELGNLRFALKRLWSQSNILTLSSGIGVTLPTADDQIVLSQLGGELYRFKNRSVTVEPFVAALYTPTDRLFTQVWSSLNVDTSGGDLTWDPAVFGGNGSSRIWDLPVVAVDAQIGYWVIRPDAGRSFGLAPFVELHWNYTILQDELSKQVSSRADGFGLSVQSIGTNELNMTTGFYARLSDTLNIGLGASVPLFQRPNRTFDAQFGLRMNYYFGRSAANNAASRVNMY